MACVKTLAGNHSHFSLCVDSWSLLVHAAAGLPWTTTLPRNHLQTDTFLQSGGIRSVVLALCAGTFRWFQSAAIYLHNGDRFGYRASTQGPPPLVRRSRISTISIDQLKHQLGPSSTAGENGKELA